MSDNNKKTEIHTGTTEAGANIAPSGPPDVKDRTNSNLNENTKTNTDIAPKRKTQNNLKAPITIGIQGDKGSFSEEAAQVLIQQRGYTQATLDYLVGSAQVLTALERGQISMGLIAIENAKGGVVIESIEALAKTRCQIEEMFPIMVHQQLLVQPGTQKSDITAIHSHPQAIKQCRDYLATHFWGCNLVNEKDTALTAKRLATGELPRTVAVIGNKQCANLYGLTCLAEDIQDLKNNLTLFLVLKPYIQAGD